MRRQTAYDDYKISDFFCFHIVPTFVLGSIYKCRVVMVFRKEKQTWNDA